MILALLGKLMYCKNTQTIKYIIEIDGELIKGASEDDLNK
jgi:hypothetical protein